LISSGWLNRHDCQLRSDVVERIHNEAVKDLVDLLAVHDEPVEDYCAHDAHAAGTMIYQYQTFQEATKARGARKIKIVNIGLEPWEKRCVDIPH
jgi:hypothetical protein